ncbi:hypothetical protein TNCV_3119061 [Trichonephila clavipes]|uniref:Uncharacterized protein n=1 Tax=Trichonephila clavipes TaxID=2585209 RepID=A0A8X6WAT7_TRICX|nr:hypothetical protein TNCV_3119061 [Trichonephila clavipes]
MRHMYKYGYCKAYDIYTCGAGRYFQATPIILLLMLTNALSVLGACQSLDVRRGGNRRNEKGRRMHGRDDGLRKTESRDAIYMD